VDDVDLVARARQGDPAAFGELVDRHRTAVYRAALAALGSHAEAEDAAQDAFVAAYRRLDSFRGAASFKTWLLTIAWNQSINRRRSLARVWRHFVDLGTGDDREPAFAAIAARVPTPEESAAEEQLRRAIRRCIEMLPVKLRDALLLTQSGDYTYEDVATMLRAPVGTIKWRVSEARRIVRQGLRERGFGDVADGR